MNVLSHSPREIEKQQRRRGRVEVGDSKKQIESSLFGVWFQWVWGWGNVRRKKSWGGGEKGRLTTTNCCKCPHSLYEGTSGAIRGKGRRGDRRGGFKSAPKLR